MSITSRTCWPAAAVAYNSGIAGEKIARALNGAAVASKWRMARTDRTDGVTIINDAYNANPESMAAAARTLAQLGRTVDPATGQPHRTWAVLGAMLELGDVPFRNTITSAASWCA